MATLNDDVLDALLAEIRDNANRLDICSAEPTTYTQATSTYTLGNKTTPGFSTIGDRTPNGRKFTVNAITDGSVTDTDDATHFALVDTVNSKLLVTQALSSTEGVTDGNDFN